MPRIFDNIALSLLPGLSDSLRISERADFCVGYFNLRGWRQIDYLIDAWPGGEGSCCRIIVGMQKLPQDELREKLSLTSGPADMDQQAAIRLKRAAAQEFRAQRNRGTPWSSSTLLHTFALPCSIFAVKSDSWVYRQFQRPLQPTFSVVRPHSGPGAISTVGFTSCCRPRACCLPADQRFRRSSLHTQRILQNSRCTSLIDLMPQC